MKVKEVVELLLKDLRERHGCQFEVAGYEKASGNLPGVYVNLKPIPVPIALGDLLYPFSGSICMAAVDREILGESDAVYHDGTERAPYDHVGVAGTMSIGGLITAGWRVSASQRGDEIFHEVRWDRMWTKDHGEGLTDKRL